MNPILLPDGRLSVPESIYDDNNLGDKFVVISPSHPDFESWMNFYRQLHSDLGNQSQFSVESITEFHNASTSNPDQVKLQFQKDGNGGNQRS